jgi:ABC-type taurine transport system ATPase subunit
MTDLRLDDVAVAGLRAPLNLRVEIGSIRAIVSPERRIARAIADTITGITPGGGRVSFGDGEPTEGRVRLVPADGALLPHLTILANIVTTHRPTPRRHRVRAEEDVRAKAVEYGLDDLLDRYPHEIPMGRRRMAGLARSLRARPGALVLEDARGMPTWGALLATAWRGYQVRAERTDERTPTAPELLMSVATVLITPTREGTRMLDDDPLLVESTPPPDTGDGSRPR